MGIIHRSLANSTKIDKHLINSLINVNYYILTTYLHENNDIHHECFQFHLHLFAKELLRPSSGSLLIIFSMLICVFNKSQMRLVHLQVIIHVWLWFVWICRAMTCGCIDFVAKPMYEATSLFLPRLNDEALANLTLNRSLWNTFSTSGRRASEAIHLSNKLK